MFMTKRYNLTIYYLPSVSVFTVLKEFNFLRSSNFFSTHASLRSVDNELLPSESDIEIQ